MKDASVTDGAYHGVDFDGTVAEYREWSANGSALGEPVPAMLERVRRWLSAGEGVRIITARVSPDAPNAVTDGRAIGDWTEKYLGRRLVVQAHKCFRMIDLWDDRAITVEPNTGYRLTRTGEMAMRSGDPLTHREEIEFVEGTANPFDELYGGGPLLIGADVGGEA